MSNTTSPAKVEVPISISLTMQSAIIGRLKDNWKFRNFPAIGSFYRDSIRECVTAIRFMREHQLTASKFPWIK